MFTAFARFLSFVLHPLLMPFYTTWVLLNSNTYLAFSITPPMQWIILLVVFVTTFAFPLLTSLMFLKKGTIQSLEMEQASERRLPFLTSAAYFIICYFLLFKLPISRLLSTMILAAAITLVIAWALSFQYKVSIHMIGIGGITGVLFALAQLLSADLTPLIIACILVAGFLGASRLTVGVHSPSQIYTGFLIGFMTEYLFVTWWSF